MNALLLLLPSLALALNLINKSVVPGKVEYEFRSNNTYNITLEVDLDLSLTALSNPKPGKG